MPYTKEQLRAYWATNKVILNQRRKDKRRLAKLGLAIPGQVSHNQPLKVSQLSPGEVSHNSPREVSQVSRFSPGEVSRLEVSQLNSKKVSHQIKKVSHNLTEQVSHEKVSQLTANPLLTKLTKAWLTGTNYACPPTCSHSYCANCWYFAGQELIDYKTHSSPWVKGK